MKLDTANFQALAERQARQFWVDLYRELSRFLSQEMPELTEQDKDMRIRHVFKLCQYYRMVSEAEHTRLSFILVTFPLEFYNQPDFEWLHHILCSNEGPTARLDRVSAIIEASTS